MKGGSTVLRHLLRHGACVEIVIAALIYAAAAALAVNVIMPALAAGTAVTVV
jgi:hypothetical protein